MAEMNERNNGGSSGPLSGKEAVVIGGALFAGGAVSALVLTLKKERNLLWWLLPIGLFGAGVVLSFQPLQERHEKIAATQEQIVSMLDELDPIAKAQVAEYVLEAELAKK
jgi:hypothetical protein